MVFAISMPLNEAEFHARSVLHAGFGRLQNDLEGTTSVKAPPCGHWDSWCHKDKHWQKPRCVLLTIDSMWHRSRGCHFLHPKGRCASLGTCTGHLCCLITSFAVCLVLVCRLTASSLNNPCIYILCVDSDHFQKYYSNGDKISIVEHEVVSTVSFKTAKTLPGKSAPIPH